MWQSVVESWRSFRREQKVSMVFLCICAILAIGISVYRVRANVFEPFLIDTAAILETKKIVGPTPAEQEADQKRLDTDGDSLSDWDEVNVYRTNPNLRDTCGDGFSDNVRVATGKNLNCSNGSPSTNDGQTVASPGVVTDGVTKSKDQQGVYSGIFQTSTPTGTDTGASAQTALPREAKVIRQFLNGKVDQTQLGALTDEQLLKLYDDAVAVEKSNASASAQVTSSHP